MAKGERLGVVGQPVGDLDAGDLGAAVEVVEVAPLLAGGQSQGEARRQAAGPVQGRTASRFQQQLEELAVVEARRPVAGRELRAAGAAEAVAVVVVLAAEHEAHGAGPLGGAGP